METELRYTKEHECVAVEGDVAVIGITLYAQEALGDLVYIELPECGTTVKQGEECAVIESVKVASEVYAPVTGEIIAVNDALREQPELLKGSEQHGWIVKIKMHDSKQLEQLMDQQSYDQFLQEAL